MPHPADKDKGLSFGTLMRDLIADYDHPWPGEDEDTKEHREYMLRRLQAATRKEYSLWSQLGATKLWVGTEDECNRKAAVWFQRTGERLLVRKEPTPV